jgi:hypothetical protein
MAKEKLVDVVISPEEELAFLRDHYARSSLGLKFVTDKGVVVLYGTLDDVLLVEKHLETSAFTNFSEGWDAAEKTDFMPPA